MFVFLIVGVFAAFIPGDVVGDMSSIGTLFAFILVCIGVIIMRKSQPNLKREFKTPLVPLVPIIGIVFCAAMIYGLGWANWARLGGWLLIGLIVYFAFSQKNSKLEKHPELIEGGSGEDGYHHDGSSKDAGDLL